MTIILSSSVTQSWTPILRRKWRHYIVLSTIGSATSCNFLVALSPSGKLAFVLSLVERKGPLKPGRFKVLSSTDKKIRTLKILKEKEISQFKKWARDVPRHFCKDAEQAHEEMFSVFRGNGNLKHEMPLHSR